MAAHTIHEQQAKSAIAEACFRQSAMSACFAGWQDVSDSQHTAKLQLIKMAKQHDAALRFRRLFLLHEVIP